MVGFATYHLLENRTDGYKVTMVKCGLHWESDCFFYGRDVADDEIDAKLQEIISFIPFDEEGQKDEKPYYSSFNFYDDGVPLADNAYIFSIVEGLIVVFYLFYAFFARKKGSPY